MPTMWALWGQLKKFGLGHCDVPTMFWNLSLMLRFLTLNIDSKYNRKIPLIFYVSTIVLSVLYFYVYVVSIGWYYIWRCLESGDRVSGLITLSLGVCTAIGVTKLIYFHINSNEVIQIVDGILQCNSLMITHRRMYKKQMLNQRSVKKRAITIWTILMSNWFLYIIKPFVLPGRHSIEEATALYGLEPMLESPNYEIAYVTNALATFFVCYVSTTMSIFFLIISGSSESMMLALSDELLNLWNDVQIEYENDSTNSNITSEDKKTLIDFSIKQKLELIIKTHAMNLYQVKQAESLFRGAIASEFLLLLCAVLLELLGGLENTYQLIPFALIQVGVDCFAGQRIMDASVEFENAVYSCKWENFSVTNMKTVLMLLKGSQKSMVFTAGGMATLSFACLMAAVRSVYSAYTTLRSTMHD